MGPRTPRPRARLLHRGPQRPRHVFLRAFLFPRTDPRRRRIRAHRRQHPPQFLHRAAQSQIHALPADLQRLLDRLLATIHFARHLRSLLHRRQRQRGMDPRHRRPRRHRPHPARQFPHARHPRLHRHHHRHADHVALLADSRLPSHRARLLRHHLRARPRRNHSSAPLLRIHFPPRPSRPAGHLHGLRLPPPRHRLPPRRLVRRPRHAPLRRNRTPPRPSLVRHHRRRRPHRRAAPNLRPPPQTHRPNRHRSTIIRAPTRDCHSGRRPESAFSSFAAAPPHARQPYACHPERSEGSAV